MILSHGIAHFLRMCELEQNLSPHTLAAYTIDLGQFAKLLRIQERECHEIDSVLIQQYISELRHAIRLQDSSIRRKVAVLRRFFRFLEQRDLVQVSPFRKISVSFRQPMKVPRVLNRREVGCMLDAAKEAIAPGALKQLETEHVSRGLFLALRDNCLIELLFYTGARVGEIVRLNLSDYDPTSCLLRISGKGRRERVMHVESAPVAHALKLYRCARDKRPTTDIALYVSVLGKRLSVYSVESRIARLAAKACLGSRVTPHVLRHTMATMMLDNGADIRVVQEILGHSNIRTTEIYTHISNERRRRAMSDQHPRNLFWT